MVFNVEGWRRRKRKNEKKQARDKENKKKKMIQVSLEKELIIGLGQEMSV